VLQTRGNQSGTANYIDETDFGGKTLAWENGTWHYYLVPEPHTTALFGLGLACLMVRWRRGPTPSPQRRTWP
jgi:hypothetical protein